MTVYDNAANSLGFGSLDLKTCLLFFSMTSSLSPTFYVAVKSIVTGPLYSKLRRYWDVSIGTECKPMIACGTNHRWCTALSPSWNAMLNLWLHLPHCQSLPLGCSVISLISLLDQWSSAFFIRKHQHTAVFQSVFITTVLRNVAACCGMQCCMYQKVFGTLVVRPGPDPGSGPGLRQPFVEQRYELASVGGAQNWVNQQLILSNICYRWQFLQTVYLILPSLVKCWHVIGQ